MRAWHWIGLIALNAAGWTAVQAAEPTKPIQECVGEYGAREAALHAAGINAASFIHECWWHSRPGQATEISFTGAATRASRIHGEPRADQLVQRQASSAAEPKRHLAKVDHRRSKRQLASTGDRGAKRQVASADERHALRREAHVRRHPTRIVARLVRRPVHLAQLRHLHSKRITIADARRPVWHREDGHERLALLARDDAAQRERYARRRERYEESVDAMLPVVPVYGIEGRRSWIGAGTPSGSINRRAVIVGPLRSGAVKGMALHCWDQNVVYVAKTARLSAGLVCEGNTGLNDQAVWFNQYAAR